MLAKLTIKNVALIEYYTIKATADVGIDNAWFDVYNNGQLVVENQTQYNVINGHTVTFSGTLAEGYENITWYNDNDDLLSEGENCTITPDGHDTITAKAGVKQFTLTADSNSNMYIPVDKETAYEASKYYTYIGYIYILNRKTVLI